MTSGSPQSSSYEKSPPRASPRPQFRDTASSSPAEKSAPPHSPYKNLPAAAAPPPWSDRSDPFSASRIRRETPGTRLPANKTPCDPQTALPSASHSNSRTLPEQFPHSPELPIHLSGTSPSPPARAAKIPQTSSRPNPAESAAFPPAPSRDPSQSLHSQESAPPDSFPSPAGNAPRHASASASA